MPRLTLPNNSLSTKFATHRFAACTSYSAHEFSTTVSSLLVVHNSTKHPVFTSLHINGKKVFFFDVNMMFFIFLLGMPTETLQIVFSTQRLVWSRDLPCWRWRTHYSAMLSVIVNFEGTEPFYANNFTCWQPTPVFFYQFNFTFFFNNCPGERFETFSWDEKLGDTRLRTRDLSDCNRMLYHWANSPEYSKSTKHSVCTRIHWTGKKAFVLGVTMIFLAFLLRKPTQVFQISISTQRIVST